MENKIRALRESTGMNRKDFCAFMNIPYRTVTDWELGNRHAPEYIIRLLKYYLRHENMIKTEPDCTLEKGDVPPYEKTD